MIYPPCYAAKEYPFYTATLDTSTTFRRRFPDAAKLPLRSQDGVGMTRYRTSRVHPWFNSPLRKMRKKADKSDPATPCLEYLFYAATLDTFASLQRKSDILDSREIVRVTEKKNLKKPWKIRKIRKNRTGGKLELAENKGLAFHANARLKPTKNAGKIERIGKIGKIEPCNAPGSSPGQAPKEYPFYTATLDTFASARIGKSRKISDKSDNSDSMKLEMAENKGAGFPPARE